MDALVPDCKRPVVGEEARRISKLLRCDLIIPSPHEVGRGSGRGVRPIQGWQSQDAPDELFGWKRRRRGIFVVARSKTIQAPSGAGILFVIHVICCGQFISVRVVGEGSRFNKFPSPARPLAIQHKDQNSSTAKQAKDAKMPFSSRRIPAKADLSRHCFNKGGSRLAE